MPELKPETEVPAEQPSETFDGWLEKAPPEVKTLYATHSAGLTSALKAERDARKAAEAQLRDLAKKADAGSEAQVALTAQADKLAALEAQAGFYDKAHAAGVKNLRLAYMAAQQAGLVGAGGVVDFAKLKTEYPELFVSAPNGNAGAGNGQTGQTFDMNGAIRHAAGR